MVMFYRNLFAGFCFVFFIVGILTRSPHALWGAMISGALSRTAVKKGWSDPPYADRLRACFRLQVMRFNRYRRARKAA